MAFDPQTRILYAVSSPGLHHAAAQEAYPVVHGWRVKETYYTG